MPNRQRNIGINIRVTPEEKKRFTRLAGRCRLSLSEYLRQLANGYTPRELPTESVDWLCDQIEILMQEYDHEDEAFKAELRARLDELRRLYYEDPNHGDHKDLAGP